MLWASFRERACRWHSNAGFGEQRGKGKEENEKKAKQVRAGKAIEWAGRRVHVLGQSRKLLQMLLHQPLGLHTRHLTILWNQHENIAKRSVCVCLYNSRELELLEKTVSTSAFVCKLCETQALRFTLDLEIMSTWLSRVSMSNSICKTLHKSLQDQLLIMHSYCRFEACFIH